MKIKYKTIIIILLLSVITIGADLETCCKVVRDVMKHFDKVGDVSISIFFFSYYGIITIRRLQIILQNYHQKDFKM